jgi:hypothetical protein
VHNKPLFPKVAKVTQVTQVTQKAKKHTRHGRRGVSHNVVLYPRGKIFPRKTPETLEYNDVGDRSPTEIEKFVYLIRRPVLIKGWFWALVLSEVRFD